MISRFPDDATFRIRAERDPFLGPGFEIYAAMRQGKDWYAAQPAEFKLHPEGDQVRALLRLMPWDAQALMDSLWDCGLRPSEGTGSAGSLAATQRHLEDMRSLVFKTPPKDRR